MKYDVIKIPDSMELLGLSVNMFSIKVEESALKRVGLVIGDTNAFHLGNRGINLLNEEHHNLTNNKKIPAIGHTTPI